MRLKGVEHVKLTSTASGEKIEWILFKLSYNGVMGFITEWWIILFIIKIIPFLSIWNLMKV
jgi:hypothetical protein